MSQKNENAGDESSSQSTNEKTSTSSARKSEVNSLPDIPFGLKIIPYPFNFDTIIKYKTTSLERNHRFEILTEHDLGVDINLINPDIYKTDGNTVLHPADEKLLEDNDVLTPQVSRISNRHGTSDSSLHKTENISTKKSRLQSVSEEEIKLTENQGTAWDNNNIEDVKSQEGKRDGHAES